MRSVRADAPAIEQAPASRADTIYAALKHDLFEFRLLPGDRFTETEIAKRLDASRTPVREALFRLQREGLVKVNFRSGWEVIPLDFQVFDELYDVRLLFEIEAVQRLANNRDLQTQESFLQLQTIWCVEPEQQSRESRQVARWDEQFHTTIVRCTGNAAMTSLHQDISERIRIIRRLDFTYEQRIQATYAQHAAILQAIQAQAAERAAQLIRSHILESQAEVRKISLHRLHTLRTHLVRSD